MKILVNKYWSILVIVAVWFLFSSPYFLKGLAPFPSKYLVTFFSPWSAQYGMALKNNAMPDVISQIYPWKKITIDTWRQGKIPLWNPYNFAGTPHAANYQSAVFSPFNLLFFILPEKDAWSLFILLQPLLAGLFMFMFLGSLDRSDTASLIGSIAFMFCGFIVTWMAYGTLAYAVLWLPLMLFAINKHLNKKISWWNLPLLSISIALSFFSGHFQISLYVFCFMTAYAFYFLYKLKDLKKWFQILVFIVCGILLSLPQILPSLEAYQASVRSSLFNTGGGIDIKYLMTLFSPDFYGNPVTRNDWFGYYAEWASYIGVIPLLLSFYGMVSKRQGKENFFLYAIPLTLVIAVATPVSAWIAQLKIPVLSTSIPSRLIVLTSFSMSVLASFGLDTVLRDWKDREKKRIYTFSILTVLFLVFVFIIVYFFTAFPADKIMIAKRNIILPILLSLLTVCIFLLGLRVNKSIQRILLVIIVCIVSFDLLRYASKWMPFDPKEYIYPQTKMLAFLQKRVGHDRVFGNIGNEVHTYFSLPSLQGYDAVYQARYGEFIRSSAEGRVIEPERSVVQVDKHGVYTPELLRFMGVKYLVYSLSDGKNVWAFPHWLYPEYSLIYNDEKYHVYENTLAYPRVFLVSSYRLITDKQEIISTFWSPDFDKKNILILEEKPSIEPSEGSGKVTIDRYRSTEIIFKTESVSPKLLFLSDAYAPGWKAEIDGKKSRVYRADYDFRAVAVPSGNHTIRMYYSPDSFRIGVLFFFIAVAGILGWSLYTKKN